MKKVLHNNSDYNFEEKDLYKLFNDVNLAKKEYEEIPVDMSEYQKTKLKKNLRKQIKGSKNKLSIKYVKAAAVIAFICVIGVSAASPGFAKNIPLLNSIIQVVANKNGINGEYDKFAQAVSQTVNDNGISLTINEALCDDSQLVISYTLKSEKNIKELCENLNVLYLGDRINLNGNNEFLSGSTRLDYVDDNTCIAVCEMDVEDKKIPNKFDVELNINKIFNVKGNWNFKFNVSKDDLLKKTFTVKPNVKVKFPECSIVVDKVMINPVNTTIMIKGNYNNINKDDVRGKIFDYDNWFVIDDKGFELNSKGWGGGTTAKLFNKYDFNYKYDFEGLKEIPEYLTVIPYKLKKIQTNQTKKIMDNNCPIELEQGNIGKLIINEIITAENKTTIKYTADGKLPYYQAHQLHIEDENGNQLLVDDCSIIRNKANPKEFILEVKKLQIGKKYFLCTSDLDNLEIKEDYLFKIPLTN